MADQVEEKVAEEEEKAAPQQEEKESPKEDKAAPPEKVSEDLEIEGLEKTDEGYEYTLGNSVYKGTSIKEVMSKARKGAEEKDKASFELDKTLRELKAKKAIREPEDDEREDEIQAPNESEIMRSTFQGTGLEPRMIQWDDDKWLAYAEEKGLRDFQINRMIEKVQKLAQEANQKLNTVTATWLNRTTLRSDITPAIQRMVAASGLDPEQFGTKYLEILQDKQYRGADGLLSSAKIIEAMHNEIVKMVKPARESALAKRTEEEKAKLAEKKKALGSGSTVVQTKLGKHTPVNIEAAAKMAMAALK